jgi:hypothetical protein
MVAVAVALAVAPSVHAADGTPAVSADSAQTQAVTGQAAAPDSAAQQAAGAANGADADAVSEAAGSNGASSAGDQPAADANQGPAEEASGPGNDGSGPSAPDAAAAQGSEPESDGPQASGAEQDTSVAQTAGAAAAATQDGVGNAAVSVQLDQPGDGSPVSQENQAQADAQAAVDAESSTPATTDQAAAADANGTQTDVQNTAVTVRVGSPGDNGAVQQANTAGAHASTSVTPPGNGQATVDEGATAAAAQDGASNTNVSIRVFSPGSDGPVGQSNQAVAAAETSGPDGASATATQSGVQNTNVSVRVESDGTSGAVTQTSAPTATTSTGGVAIATTQGGLDTNLSIVVDGDNLSAPGAGGLQVWEWTWTWDRDESVEAPLDTQPASWDWVWGGAGAPGGAQPTQVTSEPGSAAYTPGSWTWNWDWTRSGAPNWAWDWNFAGQLPCGSCVWIWNWTWNWTGQPVQTGSTAADGESSNTPGTPPDQANVAVASAEASATADVAQTIVQDGAAEGPQYAGQLVSVEQSADAVATATQSDVDTLAWGNQLAPLLNRVASHATAAVGAELTQQVDQAMLVRGEGDAAQWSGQEIDVVQGARASVRSGQSGITLRDGGTSRAEGAASATTGADVEQRVAQEALVVGGTTEQWAGQLTLVEQVGDALTVVDQTAAPFPHFVGGVARAQGISGAVALVDQNLVQSAARGGGIGSQTGMQAVYVGQDGSTVATTTQRTGSAAGPATSDARVTNQALVVQDGLQESTGALALDIQDLSQQSIVVQSAIAVSTSAGGIAGVAVVFNCAAVQQSAGQSLAGGTAGPASRDISTFCAPPAAVPDTAPSTAGLESAVSRFFATPPAVEASASSVPTDDLDLTVFHQHRRLSASAHGARATTPRLRLVRPERLFERLAPESPAITQISAPRPTQARLDTRPGDHAGAGDAGTEPPLPPAGGPPSWVSAFAPAAASGAGPSGIAAILAAFALVPPLLLRAREGSVVRRPIEVLSQVDVPV